MVATRFCWVFLLRFIIVFCIFLILTSAKFFWDRDAIHLLLDELLKVAELAHLDPVVAVDEGQRLAITISASGTSDAVHIVFRVMWQVEVDDQLNAVDVDAAAHDVGGYEHVGATGLEGVHHLLAFFLFEVGVHGCYLESLLAEVQYDVLDVEFATHEDDHALVRILQEFVLDKSVLFASEELLQEADEHVYLLRLVADARLLMDLLCRLRDGNLDHHRFVHDRLGQLLCLRRHGGRIEDLLTVLWQTLGNLHDVVIESHIEHTVGLVEHEECYLREINVSEVQVTQQSARSGDDHVGAMHQTFLLNVEITTFATSIDGHARCIDEIREPLHLLVNLLRQFSCRSHDHAVDGVFGIAIAVQVAEDRQQVGGRLASTRLCYCNHILTGQYGRDGFLLHWSTISIVHIIQGVQYAVVKI